MLKVQTTLLAAALVAWCTVSAHAAIFGLSTTAPTPDADDIYNLDLTNQFDDWGSSVMWGDRPARGQTFTTGAQPATLYAITVLSGGTQNGDGSYTIRIGTISGNAFAQVATESVTTSVNVTDNDYVTFTLETPVALLADTVYGFDIGRGGSGYMLTNNANTDYAGGQAYSSGSGGVGGATISTHNQDRIFHLDVTAIPEPASMALLGVGGLMMLRRSRQA